VSRGRPARDINVSTLQPSSTFSSSEDPFGRRRTTPARKRAGPVRRRSQVGGRRAGRCRSLRQVSICRPPNRACCPPSRASRSRLAELPSPPKREPGPAAHERASRTLRDPRSYRAYRAARRRRRGLQTRSPISPTHHASSRWPTIAFSTAVGSTGLRPTPEVARRDQSWMVARPFSDARSHCLTEAIVRQ
jgi:hypothetical protein